MSTDLATRKRNKRLVLIGGGHAHIQVIKALNTHSRPSDLDITLIDLQSHASYSGMVPGCVAKLYTLDQVQIDLKSLADWAGMEFVCGEVVDICLGHTNGGGEISGDGGDVKKVVVKVGDNEKQFHFDVVSIDIGSTTRDFKTVPGACDHCVPTRPISNLVQRIEREEEELIDKIRTKGNIKFPTQVVVVGGGAAGIELSLGMRARWNDLLGGPQHLSITILDSSDNLLSSESLPCRTAMKNILEKYDIEVRHSALVQKVTSSNIHYKSRGSNNEETIPYTHCLWATGAQAHELAWSIHDQHGLAISYDRGWIQVNDYLQSTSHPFVFAAGDCCEMVTRDKSPPKAGVYAVRSGPILIENLTRYLDGGDAVSGESDNHVEQHSLVPYHPQDDFLKLIMCGDGTALGFRFGVPLYGKWVWQLKDHIDRMFMDLFDPKNLPAHESNNFNTKTCAEEGEGTSEKYDTAQYDASAQRPPSLPAEEAGKLLMRTDDEVDYHQAWNVLRDMMAGEEYKKDVLGVVRQLIDI